MTDAPTVVTEGKKFKIEYQVEDDNGVAIGPLQFFEADTQKELLEMVARAHKNAAKKMYHTMKSVKIGELITPDPDSPIIEFQRRALSAEERLTLSKALTDPQTSPEAMRALTEAELGASTDDIRAALRFVDIQRRIQEAQYQVDLFKAAHPEYVESDNNKEFILKWLEKRHFAITRKNLELAYEDLNNSGLLTVQASKKEIKAVVTEVTAPVVTVAPPSEPAIPVQTTQAPQISEPPKEVRPKVSSSGLSRGDGSATPTTTAPKAKGITLQQVAAMNSRQYDAFLKTPEGQTWEKEFNKK